MPIYEYICSQCQKRFEIFQQKITDRQKKNCLECGGKLKKMISQSAFQLKGSGWYSTDYAKKKTDKKTPDSNTGCGKAQCQSPSPQTSTCSSK